MSDMHIILIDDDQDLLNALSEAYELADISIRPFQNPAKALKSINSGLTGAVVTDVRMPEMDGIDLFRKVQEIDPKIPVILITGHADVPMVLSMLKEGVFDFLSKPLNIEDLIATSLRALDTRRLVLENRELRKLADKANEASELFGNGVNGTASYKRRQSSGKIESSNRGILFLDKIDHMPAALQGQMLSVVENREITPVGNTRAKKHRH